MKSYRKELCFNVPQRRGFINITPQVEACLHESGIQEGLCLDSAPKITPRISINDGAGLWAGPTQGSGRPLGVGCTTAPARTPVWVMG